MIKAAVLGATGYAGIELVRLLTSHPEVSIEILGSHSFVGQKISDVYKNFNHVLEKECEELDLDKVGACDVAFTALPHGASKSVIPSLLEKGLKVIDLSGDYRYDDVAVYEKWYGEKHSSPELLKESVYGLPELHRDKIKNARLIGNPAVTQLVQYSEQFRFWQIKLLKQRILLLTQNPVLQVQDAVLNFKTVSANVLKI